MLKKRKTADCFSLLIEHKKFMKKPKKQMAFFKKRETGFFFESFIQ